MQAQQESVRYTYADYAGWDDGVRYELIDGVIYMMSPAPAWEHQNVVGELYAQLHSFLRGKPCKVFVSPFDVRLNANENDDTVVQPDIVVICDRLKLSGTGCKGVPDMLIEVLSPATAANDTLLKFNKYLKAGVKEYWIVDPDSKVASVHILENGKYTVSAYSDTDVIPVQTLDGCMIDMRDVFSE